MTTLTVADDAIKASNVRKESYGAPEKESVRNRHYRAFPAARKEVSGRFGRASGIERVATRT